MDLLFETPRLVLRSFQELDAKPFAAYRSDPEVARFQGWEAPYSIERAAHFIQVMKNSQPGTPGAWYQIAIEEISSGSLAGDCAFQILADDPQQAEIGFTLARACQHKGYAFEAVSRLLEDLFTTYQLHRVRAACDIQNTASRRLLERLGMRHEGRMLESAWFQGRWTSEDWYAILDHEWKEHINHPPR